MRSQDGARNPWSAPTTELWAPTPHTGSSPTEGPPRRAFVPGPPTGPSFDAIVVSFRCVSSGSHMFVFSSHTRPANSETSPAALTTPALDRRSLRWFGISACTATPQDLPPSLAQHGSCRRSSTSSSLPFRTHVGAGNSAVVVDLPRWGPMLSPRVPNLVPIPGPRMERETPGQRPRPNYGHAQASRRLGCRYEPGWSEATGASVMLGCLAGCCAHLAGSGAQPFVSSVSRLAE